MFVSSKQIKKWPKAVMKKYLKAKDSDDFKIVFAEEDIIDSFYIYIKPTGGHYKDQEHIISFKTKHGSGNNTKYFPFHAPCVKFITPIYHPNVSSNGTICVDILTHANKWSPSYDFSAVMTSILLLMEVPNNASPYNAEAASLFSKCDKEYKRKVKSGMSSSDRQKEFDTAFKPYVIRSKTHAKKGAKYLNEYIHLFKKNETDEEKNE